MKSFFIFSMIAFPLFVQAQCKTKVDSKKVILFIDTNNSEPEIVTAEKAACARGERLVVVPKNYKEYSVYTVEIEKNNKAYNKCRQTPNAKCDDVQKKYMESYQKFESFKRTQKDTSAHTKEALANLKADGAKIQTFMISGHDGGGSFGGTKGNMSRHELAELMKEVPEINDTKSLMLLGCYTGVQKEIIEWKNIFPQARVIGGYDGSAPLSDKPLGHQYITQMLMKEKQLMAQADEKKLQNFAKANIQSLFQLNSAMYVSCDSENGKEFYYASKSGKRQFTEFDIKECMQKSEEIKDLTAKLSVYASGEQEPPKDTANGELRQIYNKARSLEHCFEIMSAGINVNNVFNLLFYEGVKANFGRFYGSDAAEVEKILATLNAEEFQKNFEAEMAKQEEEYKNMELKHSLLETNPEAYFAMKQEEIDKAKKEQADLVKAHPFLKNVVIEPDGISIEGMESEAQSKIFNEFMNKHYAVENLEQEFQAQKQNPESAIQTNKMYLQMAKQNIDRQRSAAAMITQNPEKLKNIWSPTPANLAKYSRKELLANIHNINSIMTLPGINKDQRKALSWVNTASSQHLQFFQNPFSWHEVTGASVEAPQWPVRLKDMEQGYGIMYGGAYGGMYGSGMGGGMVGGSSSGMGSGMGF